MKNISFLVLALILSTVGSTQTVYLNHETTQGSCDGLAIFSDHHLYTSWNWKQDSVTIIQSGGDSLISLCPGNYILEYTDSSGTNNYTFTINGASPCAGFNVGIQTQNESSPGACDGAATANISGGEAPYTYLWSDSTTTSQISGLCAGAYTVTVVDQNSCSSSTTSTVNTANPCGFTITSYVAHDTYSTCVGRVEVVPSGDTTTYSYSWTSGGIQAREENLCGGSVTVTITDSNSCSHPYSFYINQTPNPCSSLTSTIQHQNEYGSGSCDGSAMVAPSGGIPPYRYLWNNSDSTQQITGLCTGLYISTVTDKNGCKIYDTVSVFTDPINCGGILTTISLSNTTGESICDGSASVAISGGMPSYNYLWSTNETTPYVSGLCTGVYTVVVTDINNCSYTDTVSIISDTSSSNINPMHGYVNTTNETTFSSCDGIANVIVTGGTPPYSYSHSGGGTSANNTGLCAGSQTVIITDALGDKLYLTYLISNPSNTIINTTHQDSTIIDTIINETIINCDIDYNSVVSVRIYSYIFYTPNIATVTWAVYSAFSTTYITENYNITGGNGFYTIELTIMCPNKSLANFLKSKDQIKRTNGNPLSIWKNSNDLTTTIYPNPFSDQVTILFIKTDTYQIRLFDINGRVILTKNFNSTNIASLDLEELAKGQYILQIQNQEGLTTKKLIK